MITLLILFTLMTATIPYASAYDRTRKDLITAATPEAKRIAKSGYHYWMSFLIWGVFMLPTWLIVLAFKFG